MIRQSSSLSAADALTKNEAHHEFRYFQYDDNHLSLSRNGYVPEKAEPITERNNLPNYFGKQFRKKRGRSLARVQR